MFVERCRAQGDLSCCVLWETLVLGQSNAAQPKGGSLRWRILIVEDDPLIALDLSSIVTSAGMVVVGAVPTGRREGHRG